MIKSRGAYKNSSSRMTSDDLTGKLFLTDVDLFMNIFDDNICTLTRYMISPASVRIESGSVLIHTGIVCVDFTTSTDLYLYKNHQCVVDIRHVMQISS